MSIRWRSRRIRRQARSFPQRRNEAAGRWFHRPQVERLETRELLSFGGPGAERLGKAFSQLAPALEADQVRADAPFQFLANGSGYSVFLTPSEAVFNLVPQVPAATEALTMRLVGGSAAVQTIGLDQQPGPSGSPLCDHPSGCGSGVARYGKIVYRGVYPGIDQVYYGTQGRLEYDFVVAPRIDPGLIALAFTGAQSLALDEAGNLVLHMAAGDIVEHTPVLYQEEAGGRQPVSGRYVLEAGGRVGFQVGAYDPANPLVIDPTTTTTVVSSPGPSIYGQNVTFTATVTWDFGPVPAGSVTFKEGGATLAGPLNLNTNGQASFPIATLSAAASPHQITAFFSGFGTLDPSNGTMNQVVDPAPLTITPDAAGRLYGAANPVFTGAVSGLRNGDSITATYTTSAVPASPVGTYGITATPVDPGGRLNNYRVTLNAGTLTITPAPLTVTPDAASRLYGAANPVFTGTLTGLQNGDNITATYTTSAVPVSPVGAYGITAAPVDPGGRLGNYRVALNAGALAITPAPLAVRADDRLKLYGAPLPTLTVSYTGFVLGQDAAVLTGTLGLSTTATLVSPVGAYPITAGGLTAANYAIVFVNGTLLVNPAALIISAVSQSNAYGTALPTFPVTYAGFMLSEDPRVLTGTLRVTTTATTSSPVGGYPITPSGLTAHNYGIIFVNGTLTVMPAALTVTADNKEKLYGVALPAFTATYIGFVRGEGPGVLSGTLRFGTPATPASPVGTFPITLDGISSPNYAIRYIPGVLTISPGHTTVLAVTGPLVPVTAGTVASVTVLALDASGNIDSAYANTVHFTSGDSQAGLPGDYRFTADDRGVHTFLVTWKTGGSQSLLVTDSATSLIRGAFGPVTVLPAAATLVRAAAQAAVTTGTGFSVAITLLDAYGNTATGYRGTVHFSTSESTALVPGDYTYVSDDQGVHTFNEVVLQKVGDQVITVTGTRLATPQSHITVRATNPVEEAFVIASDGQLHGQRLDAMGNPVGGTFLVAPGQVKAFSASHDADGQPDVFVIGLDDQVWTAKFDAAGDPAGGYFLTAVGRIKALKAGQDASGRAEVFVIGLDDQVYAQKFDAAGSPAGGYFLAAGGRVKTLDVCQDASGRAEVFVIGLDDQVYAQKFDAAGSPAGGYFLAAGGRVKALSVGRNAQLNPELFVIGLDDQVWAEKFDAAGSPVGSYFLTQAGRVQALRTGRDTAYNPEVFALGLDDQVWADLFDNAGSPVGTYFLTQPGPVKGLAVGVNGVNGTDIFAIGLDDQVWLQHFPGHDAPAGGYTLVAPGRVTAVDVSR